LKVRTLAGLLCVFGGLALVAISIFTIQQLLKFNDPNSGSVIDNIASVLTSGNAQEFFTYSAVCVLGSFLSGALIASENFSKLGIVIVLGNTIVVSIMYVWFITALIASPLLLTYWIIKSA